MNDPTPDLERLISRHLDGEATPQERRELNARLRDPHAAALFEECRALDREVGRALRSALGSSGRRRAPLRERTARSLLAVAAACLALLFWFNIGRSGGPTGGSNSASLAGNVSASWFASPPTPQDVLVERPEWFERPQIQIGRPEVKWIVVPSQNPGEWLVIEVDRLLRRTVPIQKDF